MPWRVSEGCTASGLIFHREKVASHALILTYVNDRLSDPIYVALDLEQSAHPVDQS